MRPGSSLAHWLPSVEWPLPSARASPDLCLSLPKIFYPAAVEAGSVPAFDPSGGM